MAEVFWDSFLDTVKLLPFLFISYLAVEYLEHHIGSRAENVIRRVGKAGPFLGSLLGILPQCGFSAAAAGLFAGGVISPGTLLAVFLSTSDEMLPIMISEGVALDVIMPVLLAKVLIGTAAGILTDLLAPLLQLNGDRSAKHHEMCERDHCGCGGHRILRPALRHTAQVSVFLLLVSLALGLAFEEVGRQGMQVFLGSIKGIEIPAAALIGLIPNCAASVMITQLYLEGALSYGALLAGLLCSAGTGLLVLFRENKNRRENLTLTEILYIAGVLAGYAAKLIGA